MTAKDPSIRAFRILTANHLNPYRHLATEEWLLNRAADERPVLYVWRSASAVVIGKNQNPWRECNLDWMKANDVHLARRISGGGAVYHDEGNLNYAFLMPRAAYRADEIYALIGDVLGTLGVRAERMNRTSLSVDGFKVSGNAFCFRRNGALHHGTLLIRANLDRMRASLEAPAWRFETRATESIRSRVVNLSDLTVERVLQSFAERCGDGEAMGDVDEMVRGAERSSRVEELMSHEWLFDQTAPFDVTLPSGYRISVVKGHVTDVRGADDTAMERLKADWVGRAFDPARLTAAR